MEDIYSGLIYQHSLANILNVSQSFIKSLHKPTKPHWPVGQFPDRKKGKKEAYDQIDAILNRLKENIGEPIAKRYVREITGTTTIDNNKGKVIIQYHTSKHQYYAQWCFELGYIATKKSIPSYNTSY